MKKDMSNEELRIRIAELLGWNRPKNVVNEFWDKTHPLEFCPPRALMYYGNAKTIPDWPNDLDAMREAEEYLKTDAARNQHNEYCYALARVCGESGESIWWMTICATARQRAEAFVEVMSENNKTKKGRKL